MGFTSHEWPPEEKEAQDALYGRENGARGKVEVQASPEHSRAVERPGEDDDFLLLEDD